MPVGRGAGRPHELTLFAAYAGLARVELRQQPSAYFEGASPKALSRAVPGRPVDSMSLAHSVPTEAIF